jgi:hypothetical protein
MTFDLHKTIEILENTPAAIANLLDGLSEEWTHTNEGGESWSAFDILGHLIHGENTDWISRLEIILGEDDDKTFVAFDRFAMFELSRDRTLPDLVDEFSGLREKNLAYLRSLSLTEVDLGKQGMHPELGPTTARQLLSTWAVHDLSHIAQIARVMAKQYRDEVGPWQAYIPILGR